MSDRTLFVTTLPSPWREARWRRIDVEADLELVHGWMHQPLVAPYWELAVPRTELAGYLRDAVAVPDQEVLIGEVDGVPVSYWEVYWAERDRLAGFTPTRPYDQGLHLLIGPPEYLGRGLGGPLLTGVCRWMLDREPRTERLLAEPDVRNTRSLAVFRKCGFRPEGELTLPEKKAVLMVRRREEAA